MKRVQYRNDVVWYVWREGGKKRWRRLGDKCDPATWEAYRALEAARESVDGKTFRDVAARFREEMLSDTPRKPRAERTKTEYCRQLRGDGEIMQLFGPLLVEHIQPRHIAKYLDEHAHPVAASRNVSLISQVMQQAIREGLIPVNPCVGVSRPQERARERYVTDAEFLAIRKAAPEAVQIAMDLAYITGLRLSDVLALRAENARDGFLHATEGKARRRVRFELTDTLKATVERCGLDIGPVVHTVVTKNQKPRHYTVTGFETVWRKAKLAAGLGDIHFHDLRAKHATDRDEVGLNARLALGHTDDATTARYLRHALGRIVKPLR